MQVEQFDYDLPANLIASWPARERTDCRMLVLDGASGRVAHRQFNDIIELIAPGDLLVLNDTKVIPARLIGQKTTGGKVEVLVERVLSANRILAHIRASKSLRPGVSLVFEENYTAQVIERREELYELAFTGRDSVMDILDKVGHVPLPPYIKRADADFDKERYQTVYARVPGAVAAPTAGLHFDQALLARLRQHRVNFAFVTLHIGAGTFQPVRVSDVREHSMHSEIIDVSALLCEQVAATKAAGKRVIAVGTTSVRCLETAGRSGAIKAMHGESDIFIYPGYDFKIVDGLITNFHLPKSTLLMLVSAFAGLDHTIAAYKQAIDRRYKFFSYGDVMFISSKATSAFNN